MNLLQPRKEEHDLEERVINKINSFYLIERKSSEVFSWDGIPITTTKEMEYILDMILRNKDKGITTDNQIAQWDKFWLQEEIASMARYTWGWAWPPAFASLRTAPHRPNKRQRAVLDCQLFNTARPRFMARLLSGLIASVTRRA